MRKDIVLAAAVLSVLAGLLTIGHAQNSDDGPDAFELRRYLIDRIEAAYARNDAGTLKRMAVAEARPRASRISTPEELAVALREMADRVSAVPAAADVVEAGEPESVTSAFGIPYLFPELGSLLCQMQRTNTYNRCMADTSCMDSGNVASEFYPFSCPTPDKCNERADLGYELCEATNTGLAGVSDILGGD